jgi:hypothetical protein
MGRGLCCWLVMAGVQFGWGRVALAGSGLAGFLRFSCDGGFCGACIGEARGSGDDYVRHCGLSFGEERTGGVDQSADYFGGSHCGGLERFVVIEHPAGEHGLRGLLNPLVDQSRDFLAKVRRVIEAREFKALQGGARSGLQVVKRWREASHSHGQAPSSGLGAESAGRAFVG